MKLSEHLTTLAAELPAMRIIVEQLTAAGTKPISSYPANTRR